MSTLNHTHSGARHTYGHADALAAVAERDRLREVQLDRMCQAATDAVSRATERGQTLPVAVRRGVATVLDSVLGISVDSGDVVSSLAYMRRSLVAELDGTEAGDR